VAICQANAPGRNRPISQQQKCGALAEPGQVYCAGHLKLYGAKRCACGKGWFSGGVGATIGGLIVACQHCHGWAP